MITPVNPEAIDASDQTRSSLPHVLLVVDMLGKTLGGGERVILKMATLLPQYGYRASILTFSAHPESPALLSLPCPAYLLSLQNTYDVNALRAAIHLRRFIKEQQIQVVQTFFESSDIWAGLVTKVFSDAKLIWSRRDMGILRTRKHEIAYRLMANLPDAVFAVSDRVRQHCISIDHIDPTKALTIYNGLDLSSWNSPKPGLKNNTSTVITTTGNIRRVKGHDVFIKAAAIVVKQFPNTSFSIAGGILEPDYFAELQALINDLNLSNSFHFAGSITNLHDHLAAADIFVLPSRSEGFSNAIIEAMAASLPVVATDVGGNAEAVKNGVTGFIVPSDDPHALAAAIIRLLADPAQAAQLGRAGKAFTAQEFTQEVMMNRTTQVYDRLLSIK